jgi:hypothetical protein
MVGRPQRVAGTIDRESGATYSWPPSGEGARSPIGDAASRIAFQVEPRRSGIRVTPILEVVAGLTPGVPDRARVGAFRIGPGASAPKRSAPDGCCVAGFSFTTLEE